MTDFSLLGVALGPQKGDAEDTGPSIQKESDLTMSTSPGQLLFLPFRVISKGQTSSLTLGMELLCPMLTSAPSRMASSMSTRVQESSR